MLLRRGGPLRPSTLAHEPGSTPVMSLRARATSCRPTRLASLVTGEAGQN